MINRSLFSGRLRMLRKQRNLTMTNIANELNISKQSIYQWETGATIPSSDNLFDLANYFNISLDYLVGRSDNPDINK